MQKYKTVAEFLQDLPDGKREQVAVLRELILASEPRLEEHIKWNAPSYMLDGEDRITFNLMNKQGLVKLILHMGASRKENKFGTPVLRDDSGLIEWSSDIRGTITFDTLEEIHTKKAHLQKIVINWLEIPA